MSDLFECKLEDLGTATTSAESATHLIKAALRFENVEGFGEWRILLSTKAQKYLREVRRGNGTMYEIVVKKMR